MNPAAEGLLTIRQFSELTHTPIDTLKHYDRIDILKPAYTGENKYRYYRPEQALQLTRIIFGVRSKALLSDIKKRIQTDDPQEAIEDYKNIYEHLENSIQELKALQNSINNLVYYYLIEMKYHEEFGKKFEQILIKEIKLGNISNISDIEYFREKSNNYDDLLKERIFYIIKLNQVLIIKYNILKNDKGNLRMNICYKYLFDIIEFNDLFVSGL